VEKDGRLGELKSEDRKRQRETWERWSGMWYIYVCRLGGLTFEGSIDTGREGLWLIIALMIAR